MTVVKVGLLVNQIRGVSYDKSDSSNKPLEGYIPILRANNIGNGEISTDDLVFVREQRINTNQLIRNGDIVIAASSGSINIVGKAAQVINGWKGSAGAFCKILRPNPDKVFPRYLHYFFQTNNYRQTISNLAAGANINNLRNEHFDNLEITLPEYDRQKEISIILDSITSIIKKRQQSLQKLDELLQSFFYDKFGDLVINSKKWDFTVLGEVADVISGVTKGQKYKEEVYEVPYMRVANVQSGYLDLSEIKTIKTTKSTIEKLNLKYGDILMTEGGDFDKLGRGSVWRSEIKGNCIHQNHIFRVRLDKDKVNYLFFEMLLLTEFSKRYFLKASKKTTNLATINITQLKAMPIPIIPLRLQLEYVKLAEEVREQKFKLDKSKEKIASLFQSQLHQSFSNQNAN